MTESKVFDDSMANICLLNPCNLARSIWQTIGECGN